MVVEISLAIIATCMMIITLGFIGLAVAFFTAIKKVEKNILKLQRDLETNIKEFKEIFSGTKETLKTVYGIASLVRKIKKGGK
ncbi:MAG: hypothetical protein ABGX27_02725 [Desulfurobacteriaceae bacterium]